MSHSARSDWVIGLPSLGLSANARAPSATLAQSAIAPAPALSARLRVDMLDLPLGADAPTGDGVEMVARKTADIRRLGGLAAQRHELLAGRLHGATLVPGTALQNGRPAVPAPRHREAGERLGQPRILQGRFGPALAAVGRDHDLGDAPGARIGDAADLV